MSWRVAPRALVVLIALLLALGTLSGAAGPRDKDDNDRGGRGGDEPKQAEVVEDEAVAEEEATEDEVAAEDEAVAEEETVAGETTAYVDADGDQLPDIIDNCPGTLNLDQRDEDEDGVGDACDVPPDDDGDGVPDDEDNCLGSPNAQQNDNDGDGLGNACDDEPNGPSDEPRDGDGDRDDAGSDGSQDDADDGNEDQGEGDGATEEDEDEDGETSDSAEAEAEADEDALPAREGEPPAWEPAPRAAEGPPPVLKPFVVPPSTFETIARIDAGAVPPDEDEPADDPGDEGSDPDAESDDADSFLEREEALLAGDAPTEGSDDEELDGDLTADFIADEAVDDADAGAGRDRSARWELDDYFAGGLARRRDEVTQIDGTDDDEVYLTQRRGNGRGEPGEFAYAIPVPEDGDYRVRLHFAEIYWGATGGQPGGAGKRVFSVDAEGEPMLVDYDINADVGPMTAVVKQFAVEVDDGTLDLRFYGKRDQPMVAAIEVLGAPTGERWVEVDKSTRMVRLMVGGTPVASYKASMSVGPEDNYHDTMPGTFYISSKIADLTWTPYARNYFMYWAGFDPGRENGFHSWTMDYTGRVIPGGDGPTWGCIATSPEDAAEIYAFVEIGTRVEIHR